MFNHTKAWVSRWAHGNQPCGHCEGSPTRIPNQERVWLALQQYSPTLDQMGWKLQTICGKSSSEDQGQELNGQPCRSRKPRWSFIWDNRPVLAWTSMVSTSTTVASRYCDKSDQRDASWGHTYQGSTSSHHWNKWRTWWADAEMGPMDNHPGPVVGFALYSKLQSQTLVGRWSSGKKGHRSDVRVRAVFKKISNVSISRRTQMDCTNAEGVSRETAPFTFQTMLCSAEGWYCAPTFRLSMRESVWQWRRYERNIGYLASDD